MVGRMGQRVKRIAMKNQLTKYNGGGGAQKRADAAIEAIRRMSGKTGAAAVEKNEVARRVETPLVHHPARETFALSCVCAVHDKPYVLAFDRKPGERIWRFLESVKLDGGANAAAVFRASSAGVTVSLFDLESRTPCAWCGDRSFHHCQSHCGAFVCGGRMIGPLFRCRKSCGAQWLGVPMLSVEGTRQQTAARPSVSAETGISDLEVIARGFGAGVVLGLVEAAKRGQK